MLRDVDERRQHEDKKDEPGERAVHMRILPASEDESTNEFVREDERRRYERSE